MTRSAAGALAMLLALAGGCDRGSPPPRQPAEPSASQPSTPEPGSAQGGSGQMAQQQLERVVAAASVPSGGDRRTSLAPLVERVRDSVVGVTTRREAEGSQGDMSELWERFFGGREGQGSPFGGPEGSPFGGPEGSPFGGPEDSPFGGPGGSPFGGPDVQMGVGSGVIIDRRGLVLTNNHVVEGATEVQVRMADEEVYTAVVKGTDPATDIAVLQLKDVRGNLPVAELGSSDAMRVGDYVVAIGSPFGLELTVTSGIVSAKSRVIGAGPYDEFLQTDAAINPGNSGGPLFDLDGRVVGINTAIVAGGQGIGFAVPIDLVQALLPQLEKSGRVVRGFLGVTIQDLTPELARGLSANVDKGALVASVQPGGPGEKGGLEPGDIIVGIDDEKVESAAELSRKVAMMAPGKKVTARYLRRGKQGQARITLAERPAQDQASGGPRPQEKGDQAGLGLSVQPVPPEMARELGTEEGALVLEVQSGSRADRAGIEPGDVVIEVNREKVSGPEEVAKAIKKAGNKPIVMRLMRGQGARYLIVPPAQ